MAVLENKLALKYKTDTSLTAYHTFGTKNRAKRICTFRNEIALKELLFEATEAALPYLLLGAGSNILFSDDFNGYVFVDCSTGVTIETETEHEVYLRAASGEQWHELVSYCVQNGLGGIENLALIPGKAGAAPIQNIGAYGVELADVLISVTYYELPTFNKIEVDASACKFSYRHSLFKEMERGSFWISSIVLRLTKKNHRLNLSYAALAEYLKAEGKQDVKIEDIFDAVVNIRQSKLPDPAVIGNAGSFFKNPIITAGQFEQLQLDYASIPGWKLNDHSVKVPAAWFIDQLGFKGYRKGDAGVHEKHALVLVNYGKATGTEVLHIAETIQAAVKAEFGIALESEVNIIGKP